MNSSWEQNASAANDSGDWGGWGSGVGAAAKPADQDNSWEVHAKVPDNSTDWEMTYTLAAHSILYTGITIKQSRQMREKTETWSK